MGGKPSSECLSCWMRTCSSTIPSGYIATWAVTHAASIATPLTVAAESRVRRVLAASAPMRARVDVGRDTAGTVRP